jgi:hypothetical protein
MKPCIQTPLQPKEKISSVQMRTSSMKPCIQTPLQPKEKEKEKISSVQMRTSRSAYFQIKINLLVDKGEKIRISSSIELLNHSFNGFSNPLLKCLE